VRQAEASSGEIAGIILAAGTSTRLGRPKQLLDIDGKSLVTHVAERCLRSRLDRVIVVVGHAAEAVRAALHGLHVEVVTNPDYASGQASSLMAGLDAAGEDIDAVVMLLGDQPGIDSVAIDRLVAARRNGALLGMAQYGDDRGHPVLLGRELFDELRQVRGDRGGRDVIRRHQGDLVLVDGGVPLVPGDVDTWADYERIQESWTGDGATPQPPMPPRGRPG
jgi:molybdenum cofactor cytidylyltransferase